MRAWTCTLVILLLASGARAADDGYGAARESLQALRRDPQRRQLRHHWQAVLKRLETLSLKAGGEHAVEATYLWGEGAAELARYSQRDDDVADAVRAYRRLLDGWPRHRLADDAALALAHLLADRRGDPASARRVVEQALPQAGDRRKELASLLASLPRPARTRPEVRAAPPTPRRPEPAPVRAAAPVRPEPVAVPEPPRASPMAEALARSVGPLAGLQVRLPADELPARTARRTLETRPPDEAAPAPRRTDATEETAAQGAELASIQERLRDVRVGPRPSDGAPTARASLQQAVRGEGGGELTLAQQLGLKVRRVVIDPGHGGHDTGAIGPNGLREKDVALAISLQLARRLEAMGLEVVLTRDDDRFVSLEDRTRLANKEKGDLFLSVHCNAAASHALRGVETYTLNTSSNRYAIRLAARENATSERGVSDLQLILADLATRANTGESARLADRVQRSVVGALSQGYDQVRDLGTKEALFFVLLGARMPAILVETSFISHPEEERRLANGRYQATLAEAIADGVETYLAAREQVAQVE